VLLEWRDRHVAPAPVGSYAANRFSLHEMIGDHGRVSQRKPLATRCPVSAYSA